MSKQRKPDSAILANSDTMRLAKALEEQSMEKQLLKSLTPTLSEELLKSLSPTPSEELLKSLSPTPSEELLKSLSPTPSEELLKSLTLTPSEELLKSLTLTPSEELLKSLTLTPSEELLKSLSPTPTENLAKVLEKSIKQASVSWEAHMLPKVDTFPKIGAFPEDAILPKVDTFPALLPPTVQDLTRRMKQLELKLTQYEENSSSKGEALPHSNKHVEPNLATDIKQLELNLTERMDRVERKLTGAWWAKAITWFLTIAGFLKLFL